MAGPIINDNLPGEAHAAETALSSSRFKIKALYFIEGDSAFSSSEQFKMKKTVRHHSAILSCLHLKSLWAMMPLH